MKILLVLVLVAFIAVVYAAPRPDDLEVPTAPVLRPIRANEEPKKDLEGSESAYLAYPYYYHPYVYPYYGWKHPYVIVG